MMLVNNGPIYELMSYLMSNSPTAALKWPLMIDHLLLHAAVYCAGLHLIYEQHFNVFVFAT